MFSLPDYLMCVFKPQGPCCDFPEAVERFPVVSISECLLRALPSFYSVHVFLTSSVVKLF